MFHSFKNREPPAVPFYILPSRVGVFWLHLILINSWLKGAVYSHPAAQVKITQPLIEAGWITQLF